MEEKAKKIPQCLVLIPDGNRTWARSLGKLASFGHERGMDRAREVVEAAFDFGIRHVVFWGGSELNLQKRDKSEVAFLFSLLKKELKERLKSGEQTRFRLIGSWQKYTSDTEIGELAKELANKTAEFNDRQFTILLGYSGKSELLEAMQSLVNLGAPVDEAAVRSVLWTGFLPDVDFVIRTGVKQDPHWSDWLLTWQTGNSQLYFTKTPWPEFDKKQLAAALDEYGKRERRFGA